MSVSYMALFHCDLEPNERISISILTLQMSNWGLGSSVACQGHTSENGRVGTQTWVYLVPGAIFFHDNELTASVVEQL